MENAFKYSKILVVDADKEACAPMVQFLEEQKFIVEIAHTSEEATMKLDGFQPPCVIMDNSIPYLSGPEAVKMFEARVPKIRVIVVADEKNKALAEECVLGGAYAYLLRPLNMEQLMKALQETLAIRKKEVMSYHTNMGMVYDMIKDTGDVVPEDINSPDKPG